MKTNITALDIYNLGEYDRLEQAIVDCTNTQKLIKNIYKEFLDGAVFVEPNSNKQKLTRSVCNSVMYYFKNRGFVVRNKFVNSRTKIDNRVINNKVCIFSIEILK